MNIRDYIELKQLEAGGPGSGPRPGESQEDFDYRSKPVIGRGVKGMKSLPWQKKFKSAQHMNDWLEKQDGSHELHSQRYAEDGE